MRILATALAIVALTALPGHANTSSPSAAPEQIKPVTDEAQSSEDHAASAPSAEPATAGTKKPTEQAAVQAGAASEPKGDQSATGSHEGGAFTAES